MICVRQDFPRLEFGGMFRLCAFPPLPHPPTAHALPLVVRLLCYGRWRRWKPASHICQLTKQRSSVQLDSSVPTVEVARAATAVMR